MLEVCCMLVHGTESGQQESIWPFHKASKIASRGGDVSAYVQQLNQKKGPKVFKSHSPFELFEFSSANCHSEAKIIYISRNPKDTSASFYRQLSNGRGFEGSFDMFFPLFFEGKTPFGDWFTHTIGWWRHARLSDQILFISYEEMKRTPIAAVRKVAVFLGVRDLSEERLKAIVDKSSFDAMKQRYDKPVFFHAGQVGGHTKYWTGAHNQAFDQRWNLVPATEKPTLTFE